MGPTQAAAAFNSRERLLTCIASASLMSTLLQNVSVEDARRCLDQFQRVSKEGVDPDSDSVWQIFDGLRDYPVRSRCVRLPWQALEKILNNWTQEEGGSV